MSHSIHQLSGKSVSHHLRQRLTGEIKLKPNKNKNQPKNLHNFYLQAKNFYNQSLEIAQKYQKKPSLVGQLILPEITLQEKITKEQKEKHERDRKAVEHLTQRSNRILLSVSSMFPWTIFPSTICIEDTRVTIVYRQLLSKQIHHVDIKDISNVFISTSLIFASLQIVSRTFTQNHIVIDYLKKTDALRVMHTIEGLRVFINKDIDTMQFQTQELVERLEQLYVVRIVG